MNLDYKTLIPALVAAGVLLYQAITGHAVSISAQSLLITDTISFVGFIFTIWGIIKNHNKKQAVTEVIKEVATIAEDVATVQAETAPGEKPAVPQK